MFRLVHYYLSIFSTKHYYFFRVSRKALLAQTNIPGSDEFGFALNF